MKPSRALYLLSVFVLALADQEPCTLRHCGMSLDLNPLSAEKDYVFQSYTGRNFTLNVCKAVTSEPWNPHADVKNIGGFTRGAHGDISLGEVNSTIHSRDGQPVIVMTNGSPCEKDQERKASTVVRFICDKSVEIGNPHLVAQLPEDDEDACTFFIEWRTRHACSAKVGSNTFLIIILALTATIFLISLFLVHRFLFRRSSNALPIPSYAGPGSTSGIRARMQDFTRFILRRDPWGDAHDDLGIPNGNGHAAPIGGSKKTWFPWRRSVRHSRAGFSRLATSPEEEAMMQDDSDDEDLGRANGNGHADGYGDDGNINSSEVWGEATRPRGIDNSGVIRL